MMIQFFHITFSICFKHLHIKDMYQVRYVTNFFQASHLKTIELNLVPAFQMLISIYFHRITVQTSH